MERVEARLEAVEQQRDALPASPMPHPMLKSDEA
jgi:hypothetical protein